MDEVDKEYLLGLLQSCASKQVQVVKTHVLRRDRAKSFRILARDKTGHIETLSKELVSRYIRGLHSQ